MKSPGPISTDHSPHDLSVWRTLRGSSRPGDTIRTSILPPYDGAKQISSSKWLGELTTTLEEGIEVYVEEAGNLRHGLAVVRALQKAAQASEAETAQREAAAAQRVKEAEDELDSAYRDGFRAGQDSAGLAEKALAARSSARERQRKRRAAEKDATEAAEAAARAKKTAEAGLLAHSNSHPHS